jgi:adenosylcobinamide-GDP ribazoletransferase
LAFLPLPIGIIVLIVSHALARAGAVSLMASLPYARDTDDSKSKPIAQELSGFAFLLAMMFGLLPAALTVVIHKELWLLMLVGLLSVAVVRMYCAYWFRKRIGGYTGDTLGCAEQFGEIAFLLSACAALKLLAI